jgi:hypothetical protein
VKAQTDYDSRWGVFGVGPTSPHAPVDRALKLITITCEECRRRHYLGRRRRDPEVFWLVCHGCELSLRCVFEP